jgi:uncharacterized cupin superfamily protein
MSYALKNLADVEDIAAKYGYGELQESRFARDDLGAEATGVSHHRLRPGKRQPFGHRHTEAEEIYVVLAGSGRAKLDDEIVELRPLDALRVAPATARAFEAGEDGMEFLAFGQRMAGDSEILKDFWTD